MEVLIQRFYEKYAEVSTTFIRNFMDQVDWHNRFIGISGSRGVGKTTLLMQYLKLNFKPDHKILYASLDHFYFSDNRLYDLANDFYKRGGEILALDEVHRYPSWSTELKNIYDDFPGLRVIFTGSSLLQLRQGTADLSRRAVMYEMPGLSFREFLHIETGKEIPLLSLEELVTNHVEIAIGMISGFRPLAYFADYLQYGHYPFYLENKLSFHRKLNEIIQVVLEIDIPQYENLPAATVILLKKLLQVLSGSVPFKPNMQSLSQRTGISVNTLKNYLVYMENARLISSLHGPEWGLNRLSKADKLYLHDTNLMYALAGPQQDIGNVRETFFMTQVSERYSVSSAQKTDFFVAGKYYFEVGGKSKSKKQMNNLENGYVVRDGIEVGHEKFIPLWLFGLLY